MDCSAPAVATLSPTGTAARPLTALIVDDEPHVRVYIRTMLQRLGVVTTWQVGCGQSALESYRDNLPDVVLLDVNLPYMPGTEILRCLIDLDPDAAVIVVTSDQSGDTIKAVCAMGAMGYVLKQLPPIEMQQALAEALSRVEPRPEADARE